MTEITKEMLDELTAVRKKAGRIEDMIYNRIDELWDLLYKCHGKQKSDDFFWYFNNAPEGEVGYCNFNQEWIYVCAENTKYYTEINKMNDYFGMFDEWPTKFLYMSDEEVRAYVEEGIERTKKKREKTAQRKQAKKKKAQSAKEKALSKLTEEDRKVLGIK